MKPGERLDAIKGIMPVLLRLTTVAAHLHVAEFASGHVRDWQDWVSDTESAEVEAWCAFMLRNLPDDELSDLREYVLPRRRPIDESKLPWRADEFRLFLSHISSEMRFVSFLADSLERFGVHGFVAHAHVDPGREWAEVIRSSLLTCDALVAVLHPGFQESEWTDQEVGIVMGQGKFAVAVRAGMNPYGFLGAVQGIPAPVDLLAAGNLEGAARVLSRQIVQVLAAEPLTQHSLRDAIVTRLETSRSFAMSNEAVDLLRQCPPIFEDQYERLRAAERTNVQVGNAHGVGPWLDELVTEYSAP